ncbi:septum formation family protein [Actinoplanes sp. L3-i22]|uniref:septum formation family protein n=1 Tax=Actinoplanes sp. L3-i22 TaxID=2836373 RepID=UPI001C761383|nr:septum formation family protein [Actinoplanes sp. L3-i22]BCY08225.1 hypothetical protein L3i22_033130 [Actinoplanes sp. L3-i22]
MTESDANHSYLGGPKRKWPGYVALAVTFGAIVWGLFFWLPRHFGNDDFEMVNVAEVQAGHCISDLDDETAYALPVTDCAKSHQAEVYAVTTLPDGAYPGDEAVKQQSEKFCAEAFDQYDSPAVDGWKTWQYSPSAESWPEDHVVLCVVEAAQSPVTGSVVAGTEIHTK